MTTPVISIILPTFNGSKYLENAVSSCRCQSISDWELIIVDDASTDATPEIISRLMQEESRIRIVRHETNRKLPAALNTGFMAARGKYLTWTSDDNIYKPKAIEEMVNFLELNGEIGVVYCNFTIIDDMGNIIEHRKALEPENLCEFNCIGPCFLMLREVFKTVGLYNERLFLAEDYDYWLRASSRYKLKPLDKFLYVYRMHNSSLTTNRYNQIEAAVADVLTSNILSLPWMTKPLTARSYIRLAKCYMANSLFLKALKYIVLASILDIKVVLYRMMVNVLRKFKCTGLLKKLGELKR